MPSWRDSIDALATGGAVARERLLLGVESLLDGATAANDFPATSADISVAWLDRVLRDRFPDARVESMTRLDETAGTSDRARLRLTYGEDAESATPAPPETVFVKLAPASVRTRLFSNLMQLGVNEVRFYREIAADVPIAVPDVYHADIGRVADRYVLVLEDLAARGARFSDVSTKITADVARRVVGELARLHAKFWRSVALADRLSWLRSPTHCPRLRQERFLCAAAIAPGLERFADAVPAEVRASSRRLVAARDALDLYSAGLAPTLLHGDCHLGNLFFDGDTVGFLDWQVVQCGPGMRDVTYFLINSTPTEVRRDNESDLLHHYLDTLGAEGIEAPAFEDAWLQYRLFAVHPWIASIVTAAAATLQSDAIARAGVARTCRALLELDTLSALDEIGG